jgi:hypothetical protein
VSQTLTDDDAFVVVVTVSTAEGADEGIDLFKFTTSIDLFESTWHVIV